MEEMKTREEVITELIECYEYRDENTDKESNDWYDMTGQITALKFALGKREE